MFFILIINSKISNKCKFSFYRFRKTIVWGSKEDIVEKFEVKESLSDVCKKNTFTK